MVSLLWQKQNEWICMFWLLKQRLWDSFLLSYGFFSSDMTQVIFELDCKRATDLVLEAKLDFSKVGAVIYDCKNFLFDFPKFFVKFGRRHGNGLVHSLARVPIMPNSYIHHTNHIVFTPCYEWKKPIIVKNNTYKSTTIVIVLWMFSDYEQNCIINVVKIEILSRMGRGWKLITQDGNPDCKIMCSLTKILIYNIFLLLLFLT